MQTGSAGPEVLVVEDYAPLTRALCRTLRAAGYRPDPAPSLRLARARVAARSRGAGGSYAAVLLDLQLPDGDGEDLLGDLGALQPVPATAALTGTADGARAVRLLSKGVATVPKPIDGPALVALVERLCGSPSMGDVIGAFCRLYGLSGRETDMVRLAGQGLSREEAAKETGCAEQTVPTYWRRIFTKTGCRSQPAVFAALARFTEEASRRREGARSG